MTADVLLWVGFWLVTIPAGAFAAVVWGVAIGSLAGRFVDSLRTRDLAAMVLYGGILMLIAGCVAMVAGAGLGGQWS